MEITKNIESYFLCLLFKAELTTYAMRCKKKFYSLFEYYTFLKSCFISLKNFKDFIQKSSKQLVGHQELLVIRKTLTPKLECIEYMRNKICGHIDDDFVNFAIKWNPHMMAEAKEDKDYQGKDEMFRIELLSKSMIESAINSYIVDVPTQTIFKSEIDLFYPQNYMELTTFIKDIISLSISFTDKFSKVLETDIEFYDDKSLFKAYKEAGLMDFGIKSTKPNK